MTENAGWRPFDRAGWLHERQTVEEPEEVHGVPIPIPIPTTTAKRELTEARRKSNNVDRQTRGDRQDWRQYLKPLPMGYRLVPEDTLTKQQKAARSKSIKAALEKRRGRPSRDPNTAEIEAIRREREAEQRRQSRMDRQGWSYFPDDDHYGAYPWEPELRRLEEWFMLTIGGDTFEVRLEVEQSRARWEMDGLTFYMAGKFPEYAGPAAERYGPTGLAGDRIHNPQGSSPENGLHDE